MLCDHLEGWDREGGREGDARGKRYGNICICVTDSLCYKAETNNNNKKNLMVIANQKLIIDTHTKKKKEFKHNTKDSHQITRVENKRGREEK